MAKAEQTSTQKAIMLAFFLVFLIGAIVIQNLLGFRGALWGGIFGAVGGGVGAVIGSLAAAMIGPGSSKSN